MIYHEIKIKDSDYKYLVKSAKIAGLSIEEYLRQIILNQPELSVRQNSAKKEKSRWANLSEKIRQNPPLRGAGEYLSKNAEIFKKEFSFRLDVEKAIHLGPQTIIKRGVDTVVVLSVDEYIKLTNPKSSLIDFFTNSPLHGIKLSLERDQEAEPRFKRSQRDIGNNIKNQNLPQYRHK